MTDKDNSNYSERSEGSKEKDTVYTYRLRKYYLQHLSRELKRSNEFSIAMLRCVMSDSNVFMLTRELVGGQISW